MIPHRAATTEIDSGYFNGPLLTWWGAQPWQWSEVREMAVPQSGHNLSGSLSASAAHLLHRLDLPDSRFLEATTFWNPHWHRQG